MRWILPILMLATTTPAIAQSKAQQFAAEFNKKKDETRSKKGHTVHKYKEVVATPWTFTDNRKYEGNYASESSEMRVDVTDNGTLNVSGTDNHGRYVLKNAMIDEGILTGTKSYANGHGERFKAIFLKRQDRTSASDSFTTSYGVGYLEDYADQMQARIFLERK